MTTQDDFDVLEDGVIVGRIFKVPIAPADKPWMWMWASNDHEGRQPTHGYEPTREAAMAAFTIRGDKTIVAKNPDKSRTRHLGSAYWLVNSYPEDIREWINAKGLSEFAVGRSLDIAGARAVGDGLSQMWRLATDPDARQWRLVFIPVAQVRAGFDLNGDQGRADTPLCRPNSGCWQPRGSQMAKRKMLFHPDYVREKIRASQLLNRLS